jgi:hypothetical protein
VQPEALGERAHLLSQVVERTAEDRPLLAQHRGLALELGGDRLERVGTLGQEIDPLRGDHRGDDLVHHAVAELGLAREVVEERALGRASAGEDPLERRRLEAVQVDLLVANRPVGTLCASGEIKAKARRDRAVPAKKRTSIPEDKLRRYEQLIGTLPGVESRANFGAGYTAVNGNMYTTLSKHGTLGIRLPRAGAHELHGALRHRAVPRRPELAAGQGVRGGARSPARRHRSSGAVPGPQLRVRVEPSTKGDETQANPRVRTIHMPFCTLLEWDSDFEFERYYQLNERAGTHDELPDGCLARIVGPVDTGARIIEVWESDEHARRFSEQNTPLIDELNIPPPTGVAAFETTIFKAR